MNSNRMAPTLLACGAFILGGCSAKTEDVEEAPVSIDYELEFSSVSQAVATDTIRVAAYPLAEAVSCQELVNKRRSDIDLPTPSSETGLFSPCDVVQGGPQGDLSVEFGEYAVLAVGFKGSTPLLIGCAAGPVGKGSSAIGVSFTLFNNQVSIPATTCVHLADKCSGACS